MSNERVFCTFLSLRPNSITRTRQCVSHGRRKKVSYDFLVSDEKDVTQSICNDMASQIPDNNGGKRSTGGVVSYSARKQINTAIDWLLLLAKDKTTLNHATKTFYKWKVSFVTLTLAAKQCHSDNEIKAKLLNQFLIECKRTYGTKNYLWRAEAQKNGNIHFHIIFDKFIPWKEIRDRWNRIQNKLGYVDRFQEKFKHRNPNGTDVHSVIKVSNLAAYFSKYLTKNQVEKGYRIIEGKLWGLSTELSKLHALKVEETTEAIEALGSIDVSGNNIFFAGDYFQQWRIPVKRWAAFGLECLLRPLRTFVRNIIYGSEQLVLK